MLAAVEFVVAAVVADVIVMTTSHALGTPRVYWPTGPKSHD